METRDSILKLVEDFGELFEQVIGGAGSRDVELNIIEVFGVGVGESHPDARTGCFANIRRVEYEIKVHIEGDVEFPFWDASQQSRAWEEEPIEIGRADSDDFAMQIIDQLRVAGAVVDDGEMDVVHGIAELAEGLARDDGILIPDRQGDEDAFCAGEEFCHRLRRFGLAAKDECGGEEAELFSEGF